MPVTVIDLSKDQLIERRGELLSRVGCTADQLRGRVLSETATTEERAILATLDEIEFLLDEDQ